MSQDLTKKATLSPKIERRILTLYAQGMTRLEVAAATGVSSATVSRVHARHKVPMRSRGGSNYKRLPQKEYDATVALYLAGYSEHEIAAFLGISRGGVMWRLDRMRVKRRTISEALIARSAADRPSMRVILRRRGKTRLDRSKSQG